MMGCMMGTRVEKNRNTDDYLIMHTTLGGPKAMIYAVLKNVTHMWLYVTSPKRDNQISNYDQKMYL